MEKSSPEERLEGWKRIARYLNRDVRTVRRWEKSLGLPVKRLMHNKLATVYAYRSELDEWLETRNSSPGEAVATEEKKPGTSTRRWTWWAVPLVLLLVLVTGLLVVDRESTVMSPIELGEWDWVLITDFENRTGEDVLNGTVEAALRRDLANSGYVKVAPRERVADLLALMTLPADSRIDVATGREISLRDGGIRILIAGQVEKFGSEYLISSELIDPSDGLVLASFSANASGQDEILSAIGGLASDVRAALGEGLSDIEASELQFARVTTPSLEALRLYSEANRVMTTPERTRALTILEEAVRVDPGFASAHLLLWYLLSERNEIDRAAFHMERAVALSEQASERERLFILASYYYGHLNDQDKAIETYKLLLSLYPDHFWGTGNLANHLESLGLLEASYPYRQRASDWRPNSWWGQYDALQFAIALGDIEGREKYLARTQALAIEAPHIQSDMTMLPAYEKWVSGDYTEAARLLDSIVDSMSREELLANGDLFAHVRSLYIALGQLHRYRELEAWRSQPGWFLVLVDYDSGNPETLEEYLNTERLDFFLSALYALAGQTGRARAIIENPFTAQNLFRPSYLRHYRNFALGNVALAEGNWQEAVDHFDEYAMVLAIMSKHVHLYAMGAKAKALVALEETDEAIHVLETARLQKPLTPYEPGASYLWQRNQVDLYRLYRSTGRDLQAEQVAGELRAMLEVADEDHPFLQVLNDH